MTQEIVPYNPSLPLSNKANLQAILSEPSVAESLRLVLPRHLSVKRVLKMAAIAVSREPALLNCTGASVLQAVMRSAELGLDCSGALGQAYIIPFGREAQFIPGYRGLRDLAYRSGRVLSIDTQCVYANDFFQMTLGTERTFVHRPELEGPRGELRLVYSVAQLEGGAIQTEWMTREDIDRIRNRSKASKSGKSPWNTDYDEMARKTVDRRICKRLPLSPEMDKALAWEAEAEGKDYGDDPNIIVRHNRPEPDAPQAGEQTVPGEALKNAAAVADNAGATDTVSASVTKGPPAQDPPGGLEFGGERSPKDNAAAFNR